MTDTPTHRVTQSLSAAITLSLLSACAGNNSPSNVEAPGKPTTPSTRTLEAGAALLQSRHHYCAILNEEVIQCVIYDGNRKDAKLMGVEYIISEAQFNTLPAPEQALWHSHVHEVKSGQLVAPGIPEVAEHALMEKLVHTYGKTWHTWHTDLDKRLPLGVPQLMMGFTADGQADPRMVAERDKRLGIDSTEKKSSRADIASPPIAPGADAWRQGKVIQIADPTLKAHQY